MNSEEKTKMINKSLKKLKIHPSEVNCDFYKNMEEKSGSPGSVYFDHTSNKYQVDFDSNCFEYVIPHEFGHIYLVRWFNYRDICSHGKKRMDANYIEELFSNFLNCFVDYHITKHQEFYELWSSQIYFGHKFNELTKFKNQFDILIKEKTRMKVTMNPFMLFLNEYLYFLISSYYILHPNNKNKRFKEIESLLDYCEYLLKTFLPEFNLIEFKRSLKQFNKVKDSKNHSEVLTWMYECMRLIPYCEEEELKSEFQSYFKFSV